MMSMHLVLLVRSNARCVWHSFVPSSFPSLPYGCGRYYSDFHKFITILRRLEEELSMMPTGREYRLREGSYGFSFVHMSPDRRVVSLLTSYNTPRDVHYFKADRRRSLKCVNGCRTERKKRRVCFLVPLPLSYLSTGLRPTISLENLHHEQKRKTSHSRHERWKDLPQHAD